MKRNRRVSFGVDREQGNLDGIAQEMVDCIKSSLELNGDIFLVLEEERADEMTVLAKKQKNHFPRDRATQMPLENYLSAGVVMSVEEHLAKEEELCGTDGCYIFDADQSPHFSPGSNLIPSLVTHGTLISASSQAIFSSSEHLLAMGEPILPQDGDFVSEFPCFIQSTLGTLTRAQKIQLAGNAVCTDISFMLTLWLLCNVTLFDQDVSTDELPAKKRRADDVKDTQSITERLPFMRKKRSHEEFIESLPVIFDEISSATVNASGSTGPASSATANANGSSGSASVADTCAFIEDGQQQEALWQLLGSTLKVTQR
jgi:hypothetical protein